MTLEELEKTVAHLPPEQLAKFREWFLGFDAASWDRELEEDASEGRLDNLADQAIRDHLAGRSSKL